MKKDELTYKIIGCAMKVQEQTIYYENIEVGTRMADFWNMFI